MTQYTPKYYYPKSPELAKVTAKSKSVEDDKATRMHANELKPREVNTVAPEVKTEHAPENNDLKAFFARIALAKLPYSDPDNVVLYDGNPQSPIMFIGEAPGEQEVIEKKPFVGKSGKLLQEMLNHAGILRENIYVTNVVVFRPPNNATPMPDEIAIMRPYLLEHIRIIKPRIIVLVGGVAYRGLMESPVAISKIRGQWISKDFCDNIINIFHPSYLLRSPVHRRESWHDILSIRQKCIQLGLGDFLTKGTLNT